MKPFSVFFFAMLIFLIGCKKNSTGIEDNLPPTDNELNHFQVTQFTYDSLQIRNNSDLIITSKSVKSIQAGYIQNGAFFVAAEQPAEYESAGKHYRLKFDLRFAVDKQVIYYPLKIRFIFKDCSYSDFDSMVNMLKYPYANCEVFLNWYEFLLPPYGLSVQDFDLDDSLLFFHPFGCAGLYKYEIFKGQTQELLNYCAGDNISYDYPYLFLDVDHHSIYRYDVRSDTSFEIARFGMKAFDEIAGVAAGNDVCYVTMYNSAKLYWLDYNGTLLDSVQFSRPQGFILEYFDDTLFFTHSLEEIGRFDLKTRSLLPNKPSPTNDTESVKIWRDYLYFSDYNKQIIGRVPLADVLNAPDISKPASRIIRARTDE